ncbi:MAG TPA: BrnA antitoxin family protein [Pyrinomonadaceae bacterium]|nr:BrnA antitoxin family protein [Pyrinomonadaceae bacterium]
MSKTTKNLTFIVTEEDYKTELEQGLTDDEVMKPGTYKVRRSPWAEKLKKAKRVKVSIYLEDEILQYFRARAEQPNAAPYQTQINNELRRIMENDSREIQSIEKDILNNKEFLRALKEKLETV